VITRRYADTGAMIQAGTTSQTQAMPVVRLSETQELRLVLPVPESAVSRIRIGAPVAVRVPTLSRTFTGTVARFSGRVQPSTRTMETEVDVVNPQMVLMPGMYAEAVLELEKRVRTLAVPVTALANMDTAANVLVVSPSRQLERWPVKLGIETPDRIEVLAGLREGDLVLVGSRSQFKAGQTVEPKLLETVASTREP
jgi:RND family efflux transporter MFP subunit